MVALRLVILCKDGPLPVDGMQWQWEKMLVAEPLTAALSEVQYSSYSPCCLFPLKTNST